MAHELTPWKMPNCSLALDEDQITQRVPHSDEINATYGEGGGLNANYRTVEAIAKVANYLGESGLLYGRDFVFKTAHDGEISFDFADRAKRDEAIRALHRPPSTLTVKDRIEEDPNSDIRIPGNLHFRAISPLL